MACWDIVGKALGQPVWRLLGGKVRDTHQGLRQRLVHGRAHARGVPRRGARAWSSAATRRSSSTRSAPGRFELEHDERMRSVALVEAVRDAVGPEVEILVEMHGRFAPHEAIRIAASCRAVPAVLDRGAGAAGEPEGAGQGRRAHAAARSPPASASTTASSSASCSSCQAADIIQPDIGAHRRDPRDAQARRRRPRRTTCSSRRTTSAARCSTAANLHLGGLHAQLQDPGALQRLRRRRRSSRRRPGCPRCVDGYFDLPTAPGLGVELDVDFVAERPQLRRPLRPLRPGLALPRRTR